MAFFPISVDQYPQRVEGVHRGTVEGVKDGTLAISGIIPRYGLIAAGIGHFQIIAVHPIGELRDVQERVADERPPVQRIVLVFGGLPPGVPFGGQNPVGIVLVVRNAGIRLGDAVQLANGEVGVAFPFPSYLNVPRS